MSAAPLEPWISLKSKGAPARVTLGTMNFGERTSEADARRIIARAEERGVTFLDTANVYCDGESERIVGRAVRGRRDAFVIATKVGLARTKGQVEGLGRETIARACDASLERLGSDYIDVYYLHAPDPRTPIEETLEALEKLLAAGKIRSWAVSNYASWQVLEMLQICDARGLARPVLSQLIYNLIVRQIEIEYTRFAAKYRLHTTVYNPLAGGLLSGKYGPGSDLARGSRFDDNTMYQRRYWSPRLLQLADDYKQIAGPRGLVELAYAWISRRPGVDSILVGPASIEHLDAAIDGTKAELPAELGPRIDEVHRAYIGSDANYAR